MITPKCSLDTCNNLCELKVDGTYKMHCSKRCCAIHNAAKSSQKRKLNNLQKYGTEYPISSNTVRTKIHKTIREKYGVDNISQIDSVKIKKEQTLLVNYGVTHPLKSDEIKNKVKNTLIERYGVDHVSYIGKTPEEISLLKNVDKIVELNKEYNIYSIAQQYGFSDRTLREILEKENIIPVHHLKSSFELEVHTFLISIYPGTIDTCVRIENKELDIYLESLNLGIECNGAYWHSEISGKRNKEYHIDKLMHFSNIGIRTIQIWDFEWYNKKDIVKSMLRHSVNSSESIYARKTQIISLTPVQEMEFFNKNHIQGYFSSNVAYGLTYNDELVAAMSFRKSRYDKNIDWELLRFCNKINIHVAGGASKLFKQFKKSHNDVSIMSYSHRHFSNGSLYRILGFDKIRSSGPSYRYTKNYRQFFDRTTYQKHKLKDLLPIVDMSRTEWHNMQNNGFDRIWDCGNDVWILKDNK